MFIVSVVSLIFSQIIQIIFRVLPFTLIQSGQTLCILETHKTLANSEDPDEMQHNAAFHQDLHCLVRSNHLQGQRNVIIKQDQTLLWTCVSGAHLQCVNNHYGKFEDKRMKSALLTDYTQINNVSTPKVV